MTEIYWYKEVFNDVYLGLLDNWSKAEILKGGGSAGKSYFIAQRLVYRILSLKPYNAMCIRQNQNSNRYSTFAMLKQIINDHDLERCFKINNSLGNEKISCINGNEILFKGLDDIKKLKSITFSSGILNYIWVEEADECGKEDCIQLEKVRLRGRSKHSKQITYSFNPIDSQHWLKAYYFDNPKKDTYILETTYKDNKFLTDSDRADLESLKEVDELQYKVYCLGEWGIRTETRVFNNVVVEDFEIQPTAILQGQDFGFNDPNVFVQSYIKDQELYIFNELVQYETNINDFVNCLKGVSSAADNAIIADCSAKGDIDIMIEAGFRVFPSQKGKGSIYDGIIFLKAFKKIHIHATNCPVASKEFQGYRWRQVKKDGELITLDEPVPFNDHTIDSVRYSVEDLRLQKEAQPVSIQGMGL